MRGIRRRTPGRKLGPVDTALERPDPLAEQITRYRDTREHIEKGMLALATSVDGRAFEFQASLHGLSLRRGAYVVLEHASRRRFGQITHLARHSIDVEIPGADGSTSSVRVDGAIGHGVLVDHGEPFHDAQVRPALPDEVGAWLDGTRRRDRAGLVVGELLEGAPSFGMGQALVGGRLFPQGGTYVQMGNRVSQEGGADIATTWATPRSS